MKQPIKCPTWQHINHKNEYYRPVSLYSNQIAYIHNDISGLNIVSIKGAKKRCYLRRFAISRQKGAFLGHFGPFCTTLCHYKTEQNRYRHVTDYNHIEKKRTHQAARPLQSVIIGI